MINWILLIALIGIIGTGIYLNISDDRSLKSCSQEAKAVVFKKYRLRKRGHFIHYKYVINNKTYENSQPLKTKLQVENIKIGDTLEIIFSCEYPDISKFINKENWILNQTFNS